MRSELSGVHVDVVVGGHSLHVGAFSLDVAGVLVLPEPTAVLPDASPYENWDAVHYLVRTRQEGAVPLRSWSEVADASGVDLDRLQAYVERLRVVHTWPEVWRRVVPGASGLLEAAAAADAPVAVVSNTVEPMAYGILVAAGLAGPGTGGSIVPEHTFDSADVGYAKPDPRIFETACRTLDVRPADVVHVGDSLREDVHGAQQAGLVAVHVTPFGGCEDTAHHHVHHLNEISFRSG